MRLPSAETRSIHIKCSRPAPLSRFDSQVLMSLYFFNVGMMITLGLAIPVAPSVRAAEPVLSTVDFIDQQIAQAWDDNEVKPSGPATDEEWVRRSYLDVAGRIPSLQETTDWLESRDPRKKSVLIESLLGGMTTFATLRRSGPMHALAGELRDVSAGTHWRSSSVKLLQKGVPGTRLSGIWLRRRDISRKTELSTTFWLKLKHLMMPFS